MAPAHIRHVLLLVVTTLGCGTPARSTHSLRVSAEPRTRNAREVLTGPEFRTIHGRSTLDVIRELRPEYFLRPVAGAYNASDDGLQVYLDGIYQGGLEALQTIPASVVLEVRYLTPSAASDSYGPYRRRGAALAVRTRE